MTPRPVPPFRFLRSLLLLGPFLAFGCVDAPGTATTPGPGTFLLAPVLSFADRTGSATQDQALSDAFDRVDHFRIEVRRESDGELLARVDTVVTPGQDSYTLSAAVDVAAGGERVVVTITALAGDEELFTSDPIFVDAVPSGGPAGSPTPVAVDIPIRYSGPGATAASVTLLPATTVLAPGGQATLRATVLDDQGNLQAGVPLTWSVDASSVVSLGANGAIAAGAEGSAVVTVATPTGVEASARVWVVGGRVAYVRGGTVVERATAGGNETPLTPGVVGVRGPTWSPDGARLLYAAGGWVSEAGRGALLEGTWPAVSPDGTKLAVERGGTVHFANGDGSGAVAGPSGTTPRWATGSELVVGGGSVERVRADGTGRVGLGPGELPALSPTGRLAAVSGGRLLVDGSQVLDGVTGRASFAPGGRWLVAPTASDLVLVDLTGAAPPVGLGTGPVLDPAFHPTGSLEPAPAPAPTALDPDPPLPGEEVVVEGTGFDWILPANTTVTFPTPDGAVETPVLEVTDAYLRTVAPPVLAEGPVVVHTRVGKGSLDFVPSVGWIELHARTPGGDPVAGVGVEVAGDGEDGATGATDDAGDFAAQLPVGAYTVTVTAPDGWVLDGPATFDVEVDAQVLERTVVLRPTGILELRAATPWGDPVAGVGVDVSDDQGPADGGATGADGRVSFELPEGTYQVGLTAPDGYLLDGPGTREVTVAPGTRTLDVVLRPRVADLRVEPRAPVLAVGGSVRVQVTPLDARGQPIPEVGTVVWAARTGHLDVQGSGTTGTLTGVYPTEGDGPLARWRVTVDGKAFDLGATVSSWIDGTVTQSGEGAAGVTVRLLHDDRLVAETTTGAAGSYRFDFVYGTTYRVVVVPPAGTTADPAETEVTLGPDLPSATVDAVLEALATGDGEVIVAADINFFDNSYGWPNTGNRTFMEHLAERGDLTKVVWYFGHNAWAAGNYDGNGNLSNARAGLQDLGFTVEQVYAGSTGSLTIPADAASFWMLMPQSVLDAHDLGVIRDYVAEGGRVVIVGENSGSGFDLANANVDRVMGAMGSPASLLDGCGDGTGTVASDDPLTDGITSMRFACTSFFVGLGEFDTALAWVSGQVAIARIRIAGAPEEELVAPAPAAQESGSDPDDRPRPGFDPTLGPAGGKR